MRTRVTPRQVFTLWVLVFGGSPMMRIRVGV